MPCVDRAERREKSFSSKRKPTKRLSIFSSSFSRSGISADSAVSRLFLYCTGFGAGASEQTPLIAEISCGSPFFLRASVQMTGRPSSSSKSSGYRTICLRAASSIKLTQTTIFVVISMA